MKVQTGWTLLTSMGRGFCGKCHCYTLLLSLVGNECPGMQQLMDPMYDGHTGSFGCLFCFCRPAPAWTGGSSYKSDAPFTVFVGRGMYFCEDADFFPFCTLVGLFTSYNECKYSFCPVPAYRPASSTSPFQVWPLG